MANNYVAITTSKRLGWELQHASDLLATAKAHLKQIRNVMDDMTDGVTFTTIESEFGIPTGKGQVVYNQIVAADDAIASSTALQNIIDCLGGITS